MKATVSTGKGLSFRSVNVEVNNYDEMTPDAAKACARIAFGNAVGPYTVSGGGKVYRVSKGKARKA